MTQLQYRTTACLAVALLVAGCSLQPRIVERAPRTHAEVGTVGVSIVSTTRWENFVAALTPKFELKPEDALKLAATSTQQMEDRTLQSINLALKLAPEVTTRTQTRNATDATKSSDVRESKPGDTSKVTGPTVPADKLVDAAGNPFEGTPGVQPTLQYQLATALMQEVALLNRYVKSAPDLKGYEPFIVRVQVAVRQNGRNTPYDTDVSLAFLPEAARAKGVVAVPLLMTDAMEIASASVSRQNVITMGLALSALSGNFGLGADVGSRFEKVLRAVGNEYNSLMSVARSTAAANTVNVRIGAMNKGVDNHELVPRSHMVTLMLLVPVDGKKRSEPVALRYAAQSRFLHAVTGEEVPLGSSPVSAEFVVNTAVHHGCSKPTDADAAKAKHALLANDLPTFRAVMDGCASWDRVWAHMASQSQGDASTSGRLELLPWPAPLMPPAKQVARLELEGKKAPFAAKVTLLGGDNLTDEMIAQACLLSENPADAHSGQAPKGVCQSSTSASLPALGTKVVGDGRKRIDVSFGAAFAELAGEAPVAKLHAKPGFDAKVLCLEVESLLKDAYGDSMKDTCYGLASPLPAEPPKEKDLFAATVTVPSPQAMALPNGQASLAVTVVPSTKADLKPDVVRISVAGAQVVGVVVLGDNKAGCAKQLTQVEVTGPCAFTLQLANVSPRTPLRISAEAAGKKAGAAEEQKQGLAVVPSVVEVLPIVALAPAPRVWLDYCTDKATCPPKAKLHPALPTTTTK